MMQEMLQLQTEEMNINSYAPKILLEQNNNLIWKLMKDDKEKLMKLTYPTHQPLNMWSNIPQWVG